MTHRIVYYFAPRKYLDFVLNICFFVGYPLMDLLAPAVKYVHNYYIDI